MVTCKRLSKGCRKPEKSFATILKSHSLSVYVFLMAILLICLSSLVSSAFLLHQSTTPTALAEPQAIKLTSTIQAPPSPQPAPLQGSKPQFNFDVVYAYVGPTNRTSEKNPLKNSTISTLYAESLYPSIVYFNFTHVSNAETESCDVKIEVYLVQISSDKGPMENYTYFVGTNYNPSFSDLNVLPSLTPRINDLVDMSTVNGFGGGFGMNWTTGESFLAFKIGSMGIFTGKPSGLGLWSAGEPNSIMVSVRRIGWVTLNGTSISTTVASAGSIVQVKLTKFEDGFLYNKIMPEDKLSKIDLFYPPT